MSQWLTYIDGHEDDFARAKGALVLAHAYGGVPLGLVTAVAPMMPYGPGAELLRETAVAAQQAALASAEFLRHGFEAATNVECEALKTTADRALTDLATRMRVSDLTMWLTPPVKPTSLDQEVLEAALFGSGRPAVLIPRTYFPRALVGRVTVAWKDCREAARAMFDALPLLQKAVSVTLVGVEEEDGRAPKVTASQERAADALKRHGVNVSDNRRIAKQGTVAATLTDAAVASDLLIMGAYGRWRWAERAFGGVTEAMISDPPLPVFMSR